MDACDAASYETELQNAAAISIQQTAWNAIKSKVFYNDDGIRYCEDCNCVIPEKRLIAVPHTTRCVHCQELYEHK